MNSKRIGNIGEAKVLCKFVELGIPVYIPFGDNERVDLIAEFNGKLNKIQVKTSKKAKNGKIVFSLISSTVHRKGGTRHVYIDDEIDYFACYNIEKDVIFLINIKDAPNTAITVRYENSKNNQSKNVNYYSDYLIDKIIKV